MSTSFLEAVAIRCHDVDYETKRAAKRLLIEAQVRQHRATMAEEEKQKEETKAWIDQNHDKQVGCWPLSEKGNMVGFATGQLATLFQPPTKFRVPTLYVGIPDILMVQSLIHCPDDNAVVVMLRGDPTLPTLTRF